MTLEGLIKEATKCSVERWKGVVGMSTAIEELALIGTEISEAIEDVRKGLLKENQAADGKPVGLPSELADIIIRTCIFAGRREIDLEGAIRRKMEHNWVRHIEPEPIARTDGHDDYDHKVSTHGEGW